MFHSKEFDPNEHRTLDLLHLRRAYTNSSQLQVGNTFYLFWWQLLVIVSIPYFVYVIIMGPSWSWSYGSWIYNYMCNQCLLPLMLWVRNPVMERCTRYNISPGTPVSSTNKTDRHHITEILLKVVLNTINQPNQPFYERPCPKFENKLLVSLI
jgi:hypothetical protein